ncbi:MAG: anthranilate phosphoribosyltransferase [Acidobacteria bacterium]|nr:anthranilate phosphoribosyltransferase [Acidobacteriota bacterium]
MAFLLFLHQVAEGRDLSADQAFDAMSLILAGQATTAQIAAFLTALRMKGETGEELYGLARGMRAEGIAVEAGAGGPLVDTCGTGGDGLHTFNISTAAAFVTAACGARVAKHGNRSISSQCGSADVLEALGVRIDLTPERMGQSIRETGIGFLFAPALHPAVRHAQPARVELKMRTAFNLLGPLANPARAPYQLAGAPSVAAAALMAEALARFGSKALVVHGDDGLDEISTTGPTTIFVAADGNVTETRVTPGDFGLPESSLKDLEGGSKETNAALIRAILEGERGPRREIVTANAGAALVVSGLAGSYREGCQAAGAAIDSGAALERLNALVSFTQRGS